MAEKWKLTKEDKENLVRDYQKGFSPSQLATKYSIEGSSVYYHLKKNNVWGKEEAINNPSCYKDYVTIAINQMEQKLEDKKLSEDRKKIIEDTIRRYKWGLRNNTLYKNNATIYVITDYEY